MTKRRADGHFYETQYTLRMPYKLNRRMRAMARKQGKSFNRYLVESAERSLVEDEREDKLLGG